MATPILSAFSRSHGSKPLAEEYAELYELFGRLEESHANLLTALDECDKYNSSDVTYNQSMFAASIRKIIAAAKALK